MKKVARRLVFDYWKNHDALLNSVYEDGENNFGDDDSDSAEEMVDEMSCPMEDMINEINNDKHFKHYEFQIDDKGIWLLSNTSAKKRDEIKDFFQDMWDNY